MKLFNTKFNIISVVFVIIVIGGLVFLAVRSGQTGRQSSTINHIPDELVEQRKDSKTLTLDDLTWGCPRQDCIPSIDDPKFESLDDADKWLRDEDLVFGLVHKGVVRAYPQRILNWHEIVNDTVAGDPIAITFCPLCVTSLAFERVVNGQTAEFGVSGRLLDSNLVMYDRLEESLWQQITGEAIIGPAALRGEKLKRVSIAPSTWENWKENHPDTEVLSRDTGHVRNYGLYPYGAYEDNDQIFFGIRNSDFRLPIKDVGYGIEIGDSPKYYSESILKENKTIEDSLGGVNIKIEYKKDSEVVITNLDSGEAIVPIRGFWFSWASFFPDTDIFIK
ncbi:hypothetical protein COB64_00235 [Candidatus Wolfebacteria bacterium]|nr:MAG: hypothetical protein COB64_00235 [Candidatus Wolfebacteria bacterium]